MDNVLKDKKVNNLEWQFRRKLLDINQQEIADHLGYAKHTIISMFERNKEHSMSERNIEKYKQYIIDKEKERGFDNGEN
jgi:predicted transcriptional regulator